MARPLKRGLDYFPFDVTFLRNIKVRKIIRACSENSVAVLISLLGNIYEDRGYYTAWDNDISFLIADEIGVSEGLVSEVIEKATQVDFFDIVKFEKYKILTSKGIQSRYLEATGKRKKVELVREYLLLDINDVINLDNVCIISVNGGVSTQSKEEESIEDYSKEEESNNSNYNSFNERLIEVWNSIDSIPNVKALNSGTNRYKQLVARREQYGDEAVFRAVENIRNSDFLQGKVNDFSITFDWFVKPNNFIKVLEGNYDNKRSKVEGSVDEWAGIGEW